jgi:decaprenylphospho-beta-D-ribofuranose 2-oxidase
MPLPGISADLTNWSLTERSSCRIVKAQDSEDIAQALDSARGQGISVIPHGAGHSFTDAALNTHGIVIDVTDMRRIISWDPQCGIMQVEPGVTVCDVVRVAQPDGWWLVVVPSTAEATIGGCVAMNVTGKNAWKCGPFGEHVLSLMMMTASGHTLTVSPESDPQLFRAVVGSAGLLGMITSITLQLRRITSGNVTMRVRPASSFSEIVRWFDEEQSADFLEAWVDGFAKGKQLGRGIVTAIHLSAVDERASLQLPASNMPRRLEMNLARCAGTLCRPAVQSGIHIANRLIYRWHAQHDQAVMRTHSLFHSTFYPPAAFAAYQAALPGGIESFHTFVPARHAEEIFTEIIRRSQANSVMPLLCIVKRHRPDPFLLSYQVDGFSLETYYPIVSPHISPLIPQAAQKLRKMLWEMMHPVIAAGGRFYLAKDDLLTHALFRQSIGDAAVDAFLALKQHHDPSMLFQSDLFRRVFQPFP